MYECLLFEAYFLNKRETANSNPCRFPPYQKKNVPDRDMIFDRLGSLETLFVKLNEEYCTLMNGRGTMASKKKELKEKWWYSYKFICKNLLHVGHFRAIQVLQLAALFGCIPTEFYKFF